MRPVLFLLLLVAAAWAPSFGQTEEYVLKAGDVISISVVEHPEFSGRHKIRPDGRINYPVIGEVEVATLTCAQLVKIMQGKLTSYVNNPVVSVSIEAYYANKIYVIGDVRSAGEYEIYEPLDLVKALAMAGGLNNARARLGKIIRADGSVVDVNLQQLYQAGSRSNRNRMLYPGDTFYAQPTAQVPWGLISTVLGVVSTSLSITLIVISLGTR